MQPAADKEMTVVLSTTKSKKQNKPAAFTHKTVMHKEFRKMAKAVKNQVIAPEVILDVLIKYPKWQLFWKFIYMVELLSR